MSKPLTVFDELKIEADLIIANYPYLQGKLAPFDTVQKIANLYYVKEEEFYPEYKDKDYPLNLPPWSLEMIKKLIDEEIAKVTTWYTCDTYMRAEDITALFDIFTRFVVELKAFKAGSTVRDTTPHKRVVKKKIKQLA